jgi:DNA-binding FadR family transcriptional regulator
VSLMESITQYLVEAGPADCGDGPVKLPSLGDLAREIGISRGRLREELIAAQAYGLVDMRPGDGTYVNAFDFYTALRPAILYSMACDKEHFEHIRKLRAHLEVAFWDDAVRTLDDNDYKQMAGIIERAEQKLRGTPIEIPHDEHRELHLLIFSKLNNPFVQGLLKVYWDAYEAVELHHYFQLSYYQAMWSSHRAVVEALTSGHGDEGKRALVQHFTILEDRLQPSNHR